MNTYLLISLLIPIALLFWIIIQSYRNAFKIRALKNQIANLSLAQKNSFSTLIQQFDSRLTNLFNEEKKQISDLINRINFISEEFNSLNESILAIQDNLIKELELNSKISFNRLDSNQKDFQRSLNNSIASIHKHLNEISEPLKELAEAQAQTIIKKGHANRTLYHRIEILNKTIANLQSTLDLTIKELNDKKMELDELKSLSQSYINSLYHEIDFIRNWMDKNGLPLNSLDKELNLYFHQNVPSHELDKIINQKSLKESINA
jgi:flagellar biosynthesis/type III secretory pathway protein FliH